ncbi:MAG: NACHT domain-containing protein [Synechococcales cyanobacterium RM1_1_8]|nr:NACHT domain-containing protein [Synechococcales cyanobacterium RM1_1_8]
MGLSIYHWLLAHGQALGLHRDRPSLSSLANPEPAPWNFSRPGRETFEQVTLIRGIAARIAQEMSLSNCTIFDVTVLAEVLELPFDQAWSAMRPLALVTSQLLRHLSRRRPLKRSEGTWLSFQIAYLRALDGLLQQEAALRRPWLTAAQIPLGNAPTLSQEEALETASLRALIETLRPQRLTDTQAEQALTAGAQSLLAKQIYQVMVAWFSFNGAEEREAQLLIQRLEHGLPGHMLAAIAENATPLAQLQKFVRLGYLTTWSEPAERDYEPLDDISPNLTIEPQRELYRAQLLQGLSQPLLGQVFSLKDLYVPPVGELLASPPLTPDSLAGSARPPQLHDVLDWATEQLSLADRVPVIEAAPGQGKTSFLQMFAVHIAQEFYPAWMPIVISLRGLTLGATLEETLAPALPNGLFTAQESWLSAQNPPAILLLDGLDELPLGPDGEGQVSQFLWQVKAFQRRYQTELGYAPSPGSGSAFRSEQTGNGNPRHRIFLTSQPEIFDMLLRAHPELNLEHSYRRLRLMPMGQEALRQWFRQWAVLQTKAIAQSYFNFLKKGGAFRYSKSIHELASHQAPASPLAPQEHLDHGDRFQACELGASPMTALAHQPSMLLMMGILHRDGFLDDRIFNLPTQTLDFEIFERLNFWLMGAATDAYPQPGMIADLSRSGPAHACRTPDAVANLLAGRSPRHLRRQIQALALKIHQSGRAQVALEQLVDLPQLDPLPEMYFLRCLLSDGSPGVVFKNPALGDYNCGERSPAACNSSPSAPAPPMARPLSWPAMAMWPSTFTASWAMPPSPPAWCALS